MYYVYIIQRQTSGRYYTGSAKDPEDRVAGHNSGKTPSTREKGPARPLAPGYCPRQCSTASRQVFQ